MWISTPTIVNTRIDTIHSNFRIKTLVACNGKYIIASSINLQALENVAKLIEGIAK
jgi:hypothetical protein